MSIFNNPGNIQKGAGFAGETGKTYGNNRFSVFDSKEMGIRALFRDLRTKMKEFDGNVDSMIAKYAPPNENKTKNYAKFVKSQIGSDKITPDNLKDAVKAVIKKENTKKSAEYYLEDKEAFDLAEKLSNFNFSSNLSFEKAKEYYNQGEFGKRNLEIPPTQSKREEPKEIEVEVAEEEPPKTFKQAFAEARGNKDAEFTYSGSRYNTKLKGETPQQYAAFLQKDMPVRVAKKGGAIESNPYKRQPRFI